MSRHRNTGINRNARRNKHANFEVAMPDATEEDLLAIAAEAENPFFLILENVQDPHNLGACLRSADAAGVQAIIIPKKNAVGVTNTVIEISCGAAAHVPVVVVGNIVHVMNLLREHHQFSFYGTSDRAKKSLYDIEFTGPVGIVMGAESTGLRDMTMKTCDEVIKVPMLGSVPCLNVSVTTGVCLFEVVRQRSMQK